MIPEQAVGSLDWLWVQLLRLVLAGLIVLAGWRLAAWVGRGVSSLLPRAYGVDKNFAPLLAQATYYAVLVLAVVLALNTMGVQSTSILAVLGAAGLAIALALQNTLSNIAAGIMLVWLRPIAIGEYITAEGGLAGVVVEIGLFGTRLRTSSGLYVFTPNQRLWNAVIFNHSREPRRRIDIGVTLPDSIDMGLVRKVLLKVATGDRRVLVDPAPHVHLDGFSGSTISIQLRAWASTPDYLSTLYALTEEAKLALGRALGEQKIDVRPDQSTPRPEDSE